MKSKTANMTAKRAQDDYFDFDYDEKIRVECICPGCGKRHMMKFYWTGTVTPRKYCKDCKNRVE